MNNSLTSIVDKVREQNPYQSSVDAHFGWENCCDTFAQQLKEGSDWIRESEEKPPFDEQVLCFCRIYGRYIGSFQCVGEFQGEKCGNWHDGKQLGVLPPTHWMKLPNPPNKKDNGNTSGK